MKKNISVIFGGNSVEHEISIISALQAIENINKKEYNIVPVYLTQDNRFYNSSAFANIETFKELDEIPNKYPEKEFIKKGKQVYLVEKKKSLFKKEEIEIDLFFPIVHGTNVEDGKLQGYLEFFNLPIVGPTTLSGAIGQDKAVAKDLLKAYNINQTNYIVISDNDIDKNITEAEKMNFPLIIKPTNLGSSIGIEIAQNKAELYNKMLEALTYDTTVVVEEMLKDIRELNISVMEVDGEIKVSEIEEVFSMDEILSFSDKYMSGSSKTKSSGMASLARKIPAEINSELRNEIETKAKKVYKILRCSGIVRIDIILSNNQIFINEVNNIPGSLSYYLWEPKGIEYTKLLDIIINEAIKQKYLRQNKVTTMRTNVLNNKSIKLNK